MTIDTTKPCVGRIYDYVLGGHNNFEVDRQEAEKILKIIPTYPLWARLNRWFLQMMAERWANDGVAQVLDLGSGMPTQGHFHTIMPNATVLYSDNDPMTIAYAEQVLGDFPSAHYMLVDVRDIAPLLAKASTLFDTDKRTGIGFIGVSYFVEDAYLRRIAQSLAAWATPGSQIALSFVDGVTATGSPYEQANQRFRNIGSETFLRNQQQIAELFTPWKIVDIKRLDEWLHLEEVVQEEIKKQDIGLVMYGALLERGE